MAAKPGITCIWQISGRSEIDFSGQVQLDVNYIEKQNFWTDMAILARTVRHFFPDLNAWIDEIDDPRFLPLVVYHQRFLVWYGLALFLCKLSSRRQLDYAFNGDGPAVLSGKVFRVQAR